MFDFMSCKSSSCFMGWKYFKYNTQQYYKGFLKITIRAHILKRKIYKLFNENLKYLISWKFKIYWMP